jgi:hypothetical protein
MSQENVEVVRRFNEPYEGQDVMPVIREALGRVGPDFQADAVLAWFAEDPSWKHAHPDIEWDMRAMGFFPEPLRGPVEIARWWADWIEGWETYIYEVVEYRDLGDWVLTQIAYRVRSRSGVLVKDHGYNLWQVKDTRVRVNRGFATEEDALRAAKSVRRMESDP